MKLSRTTLMELTREYRQVLIKSIQLGIIGFSFFVTAPAFAELKVYVGSSQGGLNISGESVSQYTHHKLAETDTTNTFTKKQIFSSIAFSDAETNSVNTISRSVSSSSTHGQLVTAKAVYDAIASSGGISSSDLETALADYVTSDNLTTTLADYATTDSVYSKTDADNKFATQTALNTLSDTVAGKADASALASKADASDLTALAGRVTQTETDIGIINSSAAMTSGITADKVSTYDGYADQIAAKADASALATKANASDLTTLAGRVTQTETDIGTINSSAVMTSGITADKVSTYDGYASQIAAKADVSALSNYVQTSALTTTLADYATTANVYSKTDADNKFATQTSISDMLTKTEAGTTYATKTEISGLLSADTAASTYATQTALNTLSDAVSAKADASALSNYVQTSTLTTTLADYATTDSVYSKTDADNKFATQTALNTLSDTVAGKADASALASKADASDLTALAGRVTQTETDIGIINSSAAMTSGITADKVSTYDGYASQIAAKQDALTTDQMALLNSGITAEDVANMSGMGTRLTTIENDYLKNSDKEALSSAITTAINNEVSARNTAISDAASQISADFAAADATTLASAQSYADTKTTLTSGGTHYSAGSVLAAISSLDSAIDTSASLIGDIANLEATYAGNLAAKGSPVAAHLAAIDARLGHIHGLASTLSNSAGKMNLAQNSTVEDHLVALAGAIGDRTNYSEQNVISNNQTVAQSLDSLDVAVGDIQRNMTTAQATNNARFERIESKINKLDDKINKGLAANNALAGLVPLDRCHQTQISAAMGGYRDNQALAVGAFHYVNDRILLNAGAAYGGNSSISYKVGVTFGF